MPHLLDRPFASGPEQHSSPWAAEDERPDSHQYHHHWLGGGLRERYVEGVVLDLPGGARSRAHVPARPRQTARASAASALAPVAMPAPVVVPPRLHARARAHLPACAYACARAPCGHVRRATVIAIPVVFSVPQDECDCCVQDCMASAPRCTQLLLFCPPHLTLYSQHMPWPPTTRTGGRTERSAVHIGSCPGRWQGCQAMMSAAGELQRAGCGDQ